MTQETQPSSNICFIKINQCLSESSKVDLRGEKGAKVKETIKGRIVPQWSHQFVMQNLRLWTKANSLDLVERSRKTKDKNHIAFLQEIEEWERNLLRIRRKLFFPPYL